MNFQTHGPFEFNEWSPEGVRAFYRVFTAERPELESAIGVYVVAVKRGKKLIPYYVGKTDKRSFGKRLKEHFDSGMLERLFGQFGKIYFFLIPRVTPTGKIKKPNGKVLDSINHLEFALIGTCLLQNPDLLNKKQRVFHANFQVPGYINRDVKNENKSAKHFADMLGAPDKA